MIYKGPLKRRGGAQGDSGELLVFLLDHALLMVKQKNKAEQYKVYRRVRYVSRPDLLHVMIYRSL
jgi:RHO1 GDP-GTP exchange protein 1/2